jgi:hypothetical protein
MRDRAIKSETAADKKEKGTKTVTWRLEEKI